MQKLLKTTNLNDIKIAFGVASTHPRFNMFREPGMKIVEIDLRTEPFSTACKSLIGEENYRDVEEVTTFLDKWKNDLEYPFAAVKWIDIGNQYRSYVRIVNTAVTTKDQLALRDETGLFISHHGLRTFSKTLPEISAHTEESGYLSSLWNAL